MAGDDPGDLGSVAGRWPPRYPTLTPTLKVGGSYLPSMIRRMVVSRWWTPARASAIPNGDHLETGQLLAVAVEVLTVIRSGCSGEGRPPGEGAEAATGSTSAGLSSRSSGIRSEYQQRNGLDGHRTVAG